MKKLPEDFKLDTSDPENVCMMCSSKNITASGNNYNAHLWVNCHDCKATYHLNRSKK